MNNLCVPVKKNSKRELANPFLDFKRVFFIFSTVIFFNAKISAQASAQPTFTVPADFTLYQTASCSVYNPPDTILSGNVTDAASACGVLAIIYRDCEGRRYGGGSYGRGEGCSDPCPGTRIIERTWEVYDSCGNMTSQIQVISIVDTISPVFTSFPSSITASSCNNVFYNADAADNCNSYVNFSYTLSGATVESGSGTGSGVYFNEGNTTVTITAADECGNTRQQSFSVSVSDTEPPVIDAPNVFRSFSADNYGCTINLGASATDNCHLVSLTSNAPACFPVGTTTVTWTAIDQHGNVSTYQQLVTREPEELGITITSEITTSIYRGTVQGSGPYGPQSLNLASAITGGMAPYTYSWFPSAGLSNPAIANPVANPAATTTYTLTVTDARGKSCNLSITINVLQLADAICTGNGNNVKFNVCHIPPGNPSNPQNICISKSALPAHLDGGQGHNHCFLGNYIPNTVSTTPGYCQAQSGRGVTPTTRTNTNVPDDFKVIVAPNPSYGEFLIQVFSKNNAPFTVRVFDSHGALKSVNSPASKMNFVVIGNKFSPGIYMAEIVQGNNRKVVKLVKL